MAEPVIVKINRRRAILLGALILPIALVGLIFLWLAIFIAESFNWPAFLALLLTICCGAVSLFFFGIAYRMPVALRMDAQGISGFYADPATWQEISDSAAFSGNKGHLFLGFALHNPVGFRDRQTAWQRLKSWSSGRGYGYHIVVPEVILKDATVEDLATKAKVLHAAERQ
jgi:hypothetical protein